MGAPKGGKGKGKGKGKGFHRFDNSEKIQKSNSKIFLFDCYPIQISKIKLKSLIKCCIKFNFHFF